MESGIFKKEWLQHYRRPLLIGGPLLFLLVILIYYYINRHYVSTDDAYVQEGRVEISANIAGRVIEIAVRDNQAVHKDDILFKLDDRDFQVAVKNTKAKLESAKLQIAALKATYRQRYADMQAINATLNYLEREFKRQEILAKDGISSQTQLDEAEQAFLSAKQKFKAAQEEMESIRISLNDNPDINVIDHPIIQEAQAAVDQAELNLSYTIIKAPVDGVVAKVEQLQIGNYINSATPVFGLVSKKNIWVEANFKETDLTDIRPGQKATITIDTYPDRVFHGRVVSISPCTGSSFSLLPPENATGNWVKVVQRVPVRIRIDDVDPKKPLRMGLSVIVEINTRGGSTEGK